MKPDGPAGIGGWLIVPMIGLLVFPLRAVMVLVTDFLPIFRGGAWGSLTTPGAEHYHALWAPVILYEIACNVGFVVFDLSLLVMLFGKSPRFPKAFIVFALLNLFFVVSDTLLAGQIPAVAVRGLEGAAVEIGRSLVVAAIWVPYMLMSKRVRNTFKARDAN